MRIIFVYLAIFLMLMVNCTKENNNCPIVIDPIDTTEVSPCELNPVSLSLTLNGVAYHQKGLRIGGNDSLLYFVFNHFPDPQVEYSFYTVFRNMYGIQKLQYYNINQNGPYYVWGEVLFGGDQPAGNFNLDTTYNNFVDIQCIDNQNKTYAGLFELKMVYNTGPINIHWAPFADTLLWKGKFHLGY